MDFFQSGPVQIQIFQWDICQNGPVQIQIFQLDFFQSGPVQIWNFKLKLVQSGLVQIWNLQFQIVQYQLYFCISPDLKSSVVLFPRAVQTVKTMRPFGAKGRLVSLQIFLMRSMSWVQDNSSTLKSLTRDLTTRSDLWGTLGFEALKYLTVTCRPCQCQLSPRDPWTKGSKWRWRTS